MLRGAAEAGVALLTTSLVVAEVHRLLLFRAGIRPAAAVLAKIDESRLVRLVFPAGVHHRSARAWLARLNDQVLSYTDAMSFAVMQSESCRVALTFDRHFWIAGFTPWIAEA